MDVIGYDGKGRIVAIGESKATRSVTKNYMTNWLTIVEDLLENKEYGKKLDLAYFLSTGRYKEAALGMIKNKVNKEGRFETRHYWIRCIFLEEREDGKKYKVHPK